VKSRGRLTEVKPARKKIEHEATRGCLKSEIFNLVKYFLSATRLRSQGPGSG